MFYKIKLGIGDIYIYLKISNLIIKSIMTYSVAIKISFNSKVNQSHYKPEVPRGFKYVKFPRLRTMAQDVGKVVSLTHRPLLAPGNNTGTHFC